MNAGGVEVWYLTHELAEKIRKQYVEAGYSEAFLDANWEEVVKWWYILYRDW